VVEELISNYPLCATFRETDHQSVNSSSSTAGGNEGANLPPAPTIEQQLLAALLQLNATLQRLVSEKTSTAESSNVTSSQASNPTSSACQSKDQSTPPLPTPPDKQTISRDVDEPKGEPDSGILSDTGYATANQPFGDGTDSNQPHPATGSTATSDTSSIVMERVASGDSSESVVEVHSAPQPALTAEGTSPTPGGDGHPSAVRGYPHFYLLPWPTAPCYRAAMESMYLASWPPIGASKSTRASAQPAFVGCCTSRDTARAPLSTWALSASSSTPCLVARRDSGQQPPPSLLGSDPPPVQRPQCSLISSGTPLYLNRSTRCPLQLPSSPACGIPRHGRPAHSSELHFRKAFR
jgi:hypothetical protein